MPLFFSRRALNRAKNKFSNNPSSLTRYVSVEGTRPKGGKWSASLMDRDDWLAAVQAEASSDDVLIYVHGYNTKQKDMLERHLMIEAGLRAQGYRGAVVSYDWPSNGRTSAYPSDLKDAETVSEYLVEDGILPLLEMAWRPKVHLIAHSMGAFMILDGFSGFGDTNGPGDEPWKVDQILLVSGDAHKRAYEKGTPASLVLRHHSNRLTNYFSTRDEILSLAFIYHGRERVGLSGMPDLVFPEHIDLYCTEQYLKYKPTTGDEALNSHRWWFENEGFFEDVALTLAGQDETTMPTRRTTSTGGWALLT